MEDLPREIMLNILARLPATSLIQLKLVCRLWNDIIRDPYFRKMQSSNPKNNEDECLILHCDYPGENEFHFVHVSKSDEGNIVMEKRQSVQGLPEFKVIGSTHRLFCLLDDQGNKNTLFIYNLLKSESITLPKIKQDEHASAVYGFGFDERAKAYKVVRITCDESISTVQVLTLGRGAEWRQKESIPHRLNAKHSSVFVNGKLHWISASPRRRHGSIILFDLHDEQFLELKKPQESGRKPFHMATLGERLSVAGSYYDGFGIWVMKDYDSTFWSKYCTIGFVPVPSGLGLYVFRDCRDSKFCGLIIRFVCVLSNGQILLQYLHECLLSYDPKTGMFKEFELKLPCLFETIPLLGSLNTLENFI